MNLARIPVAIVAAFVSLPPVSGQTQQFEDVAEKCGLSWQGPTFSHYGMLAAWVDYNADGLDDLYFQPHSNSRGKSVLFWRNNKGQFQLMPTKEIVPDGYAHGGGDIHMASWGDFNNDGYPDLFIQNGGAAGSGTLHARHLLENNNGALRYVSKDYGIDGMYGSGRSALWFDYNNDGFLDIYCALMTRAEQKDKTQSPINATIVTPPALFHNRGNGNHWIELNLVGTTSARDPVGAKVFVTAGGKRQLREFTRFNHRTGQDMRRLHFGLGKNTTIDAVEIHWRSGAIQKLSNMKTDQILPITETRNGGQNP